MRKLAEDTTRCFIFDRFIWLVHFPAESIPIAGCLGRDKAAPYMYMYM